MDKKSDFDLSNVGGKPRDWLERGGDYEARFSWWDDIKMVVTFVGLPLLLLACGAAFVYALLQGGR